MSTFPFTTNTELNQRATLGLIVLKADETIELEFRHLLSDDVAVHVSRVESQAQVTPATLMKMKNRLTKSASLLPDAARFDCVGYACTSGTSVIGAGDVEALIKAGCSTAAVTNPVSALIAACNQLGATRIAILSPYVEDVSQVLRTVLSQNGIETPVFGSFNEADEATVVRIDRQSIIDAAITLTKGVDIDALFISCTNLRTLSAIDDIKAAIGKPVLSSNQALAWHMAKLSDISISALEL